MMFFDLTNLEQEKFGCWDFQHQSTFCVLMGLTFSLKTQKWTVYVNFSKTVTKRNKKKQPKRLVTKKTIQFILNLISGKNINMDDCMTVTTITAKP